MIFQIFKLSNHNLSVQQQRLENINSHINNISFNQMTQELRGYAVHPKLDCPHLTQKVVDELKEFLLSKNTHHFSQFQCSTCQDKSQNWICLECRTIACSRYVKGHMAQHHDQAKHPITLSFSDSSFWCYECDSYIDHPMLVKARRQFSNSKFAVSLEVEKNQKKEEEEQQQLAEALKKMDINQKQEKKQEQKFSYENIIQKLKNKQYKKVVFLTGAGLSVAAGIPDFRTPGTGLYAQLQKYNLPRPQSIFQLTYFAKNPQPFIKLAKQCFSGIYQPTDGHKFIKKFQDQNLLSYCMTQNIDDLETKAGLSPQKLIQAHGHSRSAHCIKCKKQRNIEDWVKSIQKEQVLKCNYEDCGSLIKPDIVFFGEQLPVQFHEAPGHVQKADLVFIIGTSLAVYPFAFLAHSVPKEVPVILINNDDSLPQRKEKVWLSGDLQQNIRKIAKDLDWTL